MTVTAITLNEQVVAPGIVVLMTITATEEPKNGISASFTDQIYNTNASINKTIKSFEISGNNTWTAEVELTGEEMLTLTGGFTDPVSLAVYRDGKSAVKNNLLWNATPDIVNVVAKPGSEQINLTLTLNSNYHYSELTGYVKYTTENNPTDICMVSIDLSQVDDSAEYTGVVTGLSLGESYELHVIAENEYGTSNSITIQNIMTSYNPGVVSIDYFDSLDVSGAVFDFTVAPFDYSDYTTLNLVLDYIVGSESKGTQSISVDICGVTNPDYPTFTQAYDMNRRIMNTEIMGAIGVGNTFNVEAKLEATLDVSGVGPRTYTGPIAKKTYVMDKNMGDPEVTLSVVDWVNGSQIIQAVVDACFNNVTFVFDLSGAKTDVTSYDICGGTQTMTATKLYVHNELNEVGKKVTVSGYRPELNGGASKATFGPVELDFNLVAIKRASSPNAVIEINKVEREVVARFTGISDLCYNDVYANEAYADVVMISASPNEIVNSNVASRDPSGNATVTVSDLTLVGGERYSANAYTRFNMGSNGANFPSRYIELNANSAYLNSVPTSSQFVYSESPTLELFVRPENAEGTVLNTVRFEGNMKGNDVVELICFARDVSGNLVEKKLQVDASTLDSCGNNLSGRTLGDLANTFAHDFVFDAEIEIGDNKMFLVGIIDTDNAYDAIITKKDAAPNAKTFKEAADAYNTSLSVYNAALDLSNNPSGDEDYVEYANLISLIDASINDVTLEIKKLQQDASGSGIGSENYVNNATVALAIATEKYNIAAYNVDVIGNANDTYDASFLNMTPSEQTLYKVSGSVSFQKAVYDVNKPYVSPSDGSFVTITVTGNSNVSLETQLNGLEIQYNNVFKSDISKKDTAQDTLDDAVDAKNKIESDLENAILLLGKEENTDETTLYGQLYSTTTERDNKAASFVSAAGFAQSALEGAESSLSTARKLFFPNLQ